MSEPKTIGQEAAERIEKELGPSWTSLSWRKSASIIDKVVSERGMVSGEQYAEIHRIAVEKDRLWSEACNERNALLRERVEQLKPWWVTEHSDGTSELFYGHSQNSLLVDKSLTGIIHSAANAHNAALPVHKK